MPLIAQLLAWLGLAEQPAQLDTISAFLQGASIQQIAAQWPGEMLANQQRVQAALRAYVNQLEAEIEALQAQL